MFAKCFQVTVDFLTSTGYCSEVRIKAGVSGGLSAQDNTLRSNTAFRLIKRVEQSDPGYVDHNVKFILYCAAVF